MVSASFDLDVNFVSGSMAMEDSLQGPLDFLSAVKAGSVPISDAPVWTQEGTFHTFTWSRAGR